MGSPPQIETIGAPHSSDAAKHCSTVIISLIVDLYSRMRPQPVQVKLQACNGSSIMTMGNFLVPRKRWPATYFARFAVILMGYLNSLSWNLAAGIPAAAASIRETDLPRQPCCDSAPTRTMENNC